jgi:preprotein translocase subunit Sec61beta
MAQAPKGAKVPKKRGLLGFFDSKGRKRGSKIDPKTRFTG